MKEILKPSTLTVVAVLAGCAPSEDSPTVAVKSTAVARAARRAYDGAPPTIAHPPFGRCQSCHHDDGIEIPGYGIAPPSPHEQTDGTDAGETGKWSRCQQCHVFRTSEDTFRESTFVGLAQDLRVGKRHYPGAPPVIPHQVLLRENCRACHTGRTAREEIRCSHPERIRCQQCHVSVQATASFVRG